MLEQTQFIPTASQPDQNYPEPPKEFDSYSTSDSEKNFYNKKNEKNLEFSPNISEEKPFYKFLNDQETSLYIIMENFDKKHKGKDTFYQFQKLQEYLKIGLGIDDKTGEDMIKNHIQVIETTFDRVKYNYFKFKLQISKRMASFFLEQDYIYEQDLITFFSESSKQKLKKNSLLDQKRKITPFEKNPRYSILHSEFEQTKIFQFDSPRNNDDACKALELSNQQLMSRLAHLEQSLHEESQKKNYYKSLYETKCKEIHEMYSKQLFMFEFNNIDKIESEN